MHKGNKIATSEPTRHFREHSVCMHCRPSTESQNRRTETHESTKEKRTHLGTTRPRKGEASESDTRAFLGELATGAAANSSAHMACPPPTSQRLTTRHDRQAVLHATARWGRGEGRGEGRHLSSGRGKGGAAHGVRRTETAVRR